jgi:hypothetical protein
VQLAIRPGFRSRPASVLDFVVALCVIASVASPWWISVPPAHLQETFGFQSPACWVAVVALFIALFVEARAAVVELAAVELVLVAWFGWAMWVVTTPRFAQLGFPFVHRLILLVISKEYPHGHDLEHGDRAVQDGSARRTCRLERPG